MKQTKFNLYQGSHGGRRPGTGRPRLHSKGVAHRTRELINHRTPMHINFKYNCAIRTKRALRILKRAIINARKQGLRVNHFSLQSNHVHLIVEAEDNDILTSGMRSLTVTFSKGLGKGKNQLERFHLHVLRSVRETRNAVHYVLFNEQKHSGSKNVLIDEFTSLSFLGITKVRELAKLKRWGLIWRDVFWKMDECQTWLLRQALLT